MGELWMGILTLLPVLACLAVVWRLAVAPFDAFILENRIWRGEVVWNGG